MKYNYNGLHMPVIRKVIAILLTVIAVTSLFLLLCVGANDQVARTSVRTEQGLTRPDNIEKTEQRVSDAPAGVVETYTFTLGDEISGDTSLGFYTVHQYVNVRLDGRKVYCVEPVGQYRMTKTVGSNWVMIPLRSEDEGKEVTVEITPVYEKFRNREVDFVIGSPVVIYRDCLRTDLPQLILSGLAILTGILFLGIAGYERLRKRQGNGLFSLGLFSIMLGIWRMFDARFTPFMDFGHPVLVYYISTVMMMLAVFPLLQWMMAYFTEKGKMILEGYKIWGGGAARLPDTVAVAITGNHGYSGDPDSDTYSSRYWSGLSDSSRAV